MARHRNDHRDLFSLEWLEIHTLTGARSAIFAASMSALIVEPFTVVLAHSASGRRISRGL